MTNEMNVLTDHGSYWTNPEGFLIPLVRHLDAALGDAVGVALLPGSCRPDAADRVASTARVDARGMGLAVFGGCDRDRPRADRAPGGR